MQSPIEYYIKHVYGVPRHYINDPKTAKAISALTGCATLEPRHRFALEALGFTFRQILPPMFRAND